MEFNNLLLETGEGIATLTINRPKALNALNEETLKELHCCFAGLRSDPAIKVVILTGAGDKAFVAGADIAAMQGFDALAAREFARLGHEVFNLIEKLPQPVIAAVNGFALGGGCELAMACDIRLAGENARFGQPEVNLGVIPGFGGTLRLARLVGKGRAKELILTGDLIDAQEARRIGLVNQVLPSGDLLEGARKMAQKIASKGQVAVRLGKEAIDNGLEMDQDRAGRYEAELFGLCFATADQKEGMSAFLEKRAAQFQGR
ncbi:enoyl-CoA hydratase-related protein [Geoalkalibacter sp.]|uniref:enoyl-CoA hydratase-related protein n=1 Tax=Geoalkalibacter sp. TaxID=3041440 RepID=UPI00272EE482|nr:enoyl-CoA hydratase-related protein [Geoalkalibacter sp.]